MLTAEQQRQLIASLDSDGDQQPQARELLGISEQQYQQLQSQVGGAQQLADELERIGIRCCYATDDNRGRKIIIAEPPLAGATSQATSQRVAEILWPIVPEQHSLLVVFCSAVNSAIFNLLPKDHLVMFLDPHGRRRKAAPDDSWAAIPGGWRRDNFILPQKGYFITHKQGYYRLSASRARDSQAELKELTSGQWPLALNLQQQQEARKTIARVEALQQLIDEYEDYQHQRQEQLAELQEDRRDYLADIEYQRQELTELRNELRETERQLAASERHCQQTDSKIANLENNSALDQRQMIAQGCQFIALAEEISSWPQVARAEVFEPFYDQDYGAELAIELNSEDFGGRAISFVVSQGHVEVTGADAQALESRQLAIAEKFASGQWLELVKIIIGALNSK